MKKILMSVLVIAVVVGVVVGASGAYFSDEETSTGNTFQAGTIDLAVNGENPWVSKAFTFTDIKPCHDLAPFEFTLKNVGQNCGILHNSIDFSENDKPEDTGADFEFSAGVNPAMEMSADEFASLVYVAAVTHEYNDSGVVRDELPSWMAMDTNSDGKVSLYEMKQASPIPWGDPAIIDDCLPAGDWSTFMITFHLGDSLDPFQAGGKIVLGVLDNRPQADGIDVTITATLTQVP